MKQQRSNVVVAVIISGTALYGLGAFKQKEMTYATVNFDGGFKKIGEIAEQRAFSKIKVTMEDNTIYSGEISEVLAEIKQSLDEEKEKEKASIIWKEGVRIKGNIGVSWIGSESSFELTTDTLDLTSTEAQPIVVVEIISKLEAMDAHIKSKHNEYSKKALTFSEKPESSFVLSKLIAALSS